MWNKMNAGTKRFFAKTKDVLTPDKPPSPHRSASHTTRKAPSQRTKQAKKGWINTWFEPKEPQGPQTVNEFLKQPRPEF
jgi:hypothetical protein